MVHVCFSHIRKSFNFEHSNTQKQIANVVKYSILTENIAISLREIYLTRFLEISRTKKFKNDMHTFLTNLFSVTFYYLFQKNDWKFQTFFKISDAVTFLKPSTNFEKEKKENQSRYIWREVWVKFMANTALHWMNSTLLKNDLRLIIISIVKMRWYKRFVYGNKYERGKLRF